MKRQYALPIAFAAAAHGALLFGFTKTPRAAPAAPADETPRVQMLPPPPPIEEEPVPVDADSRSSAAKPILESPPRSAEPVAALHPTEAPTMPVPPVTPFESRDVKLIPADAFASPRGDGTGSGFGGDIIGTALLDNPPRTRFQAAPIFPHEGKVQGLHGEVLVEFVVDPSGRVRDAHVVRSSHRVFEEPSLRAISKWVFEPGRRHGRVVAFKMSVPVVFTLTE